MKMKNDFSHSEKYSVQSVVRALDIIEEIIVEPLGITQIAEKVNLSVATVFRLAATLEGKGIISQNDKKQYVAGSTLSRWLSNLETLMLLEPVLTEELFKLRDQLDETIAFYIRKGNFRVCVQSADSRRLVKRTIPKYTPEPLMFGAVSKVFLAFCGDTQGEEMIREIAATRNEEVEAVKSQLDEVRSNEWAYSFDETGNESWSIAVPIKKKSLTIGVLAVLAPVTRHNPKVVEEYLAGLLECKSTLDQKLNWL